MNVRIITDSGSDILPETAEQWNITVIPLIVRFGEEEFYDGVTLSREEFYTHLIKEKQIPKTSQITPVVYEKEFRKALYNGEDVVCLVLSQQVSGCYQSACIARNEIEDDDPELAKRIYIVDCMQFCGSLYILVQWATDLRDKGYSAGEITEAIEKNKTKCWVISLFDTLEYLKLGGRISQVTATAGNLLSIKPVVTVEDGVVKVVGKARGSRNGNSMVTQFIRRKGGVDWTKPTVFSYTGFSPNRLNQFIEDNPSLFDGHYKDGYPISHVGATVGTYAGPDAFAFSFFQNEETK